MSDAAQLQHGRRELVFAVLLWLGWMVGTLLLTIAVLGADAGKADDADLATDPEARARLMWALGAQSTATLAVLAVVALRPPSIRLGLARGDLRTVAIAYPVFFVVWAAFVGLVYAPLWQALGQEPEAQPQLALVRHAGPGGLAMLAVAIALIAPVFEECLFRGYLFGGVSRLHGARAAIVSTSLVFGLVHAGTGFYPVLPLVLIGAFFGWLRLRTAGLAAPILAHVVHNAFTIALTRTFPDLTP